MNNSHDVAFVIATDGETTDGEADPYRLSIGVMPQVGHFVNLNDKQYRIVRVTWCTLGPPKNVGAVFALLPTMVPVFTIVADDSPVSS